MLKGALRVMVRAAVCSAQGQTPAKDLETQYLANVFPPCPREGEEDGLRDIRKVW